MCRLQNFAILHENVWKNATVMVRKKKLLHHHEKFTKITMRESSQRNDEIN